MGHKTRIATLALGAVLLLVSGAEAGGPNRGLAAGLGALASAPPHRLPALESAPHRPASVTVPVPEAPVVVPADKSPNSRGGVTRTSRVSVGAAGSVPAQVLAAYTLAVATAPPSCRISVSLLAAIGQVESGNLAGHQLDAGHRAVPAVLGPVLDGQRFAAIADTDDGQWDGNRLWDRALGPMQLIPSSWRVVGVDMDRDGLRDPQDIYDAAGAAMVYLCAGGRDLATPAGMQAAVLAYNHSAVYLNRVLAWKAVYDTTDLTGLGSPSPSMFHASALPAPATRVPAAALTPAGASQLQTRPAKTRAATPAHGWSPRPPVPSGSTPAPGQTPTPTSPTSPPTSEPTPTDPTTDPTPTDPAPDPTPTDPTTDPTPTDPAPDPTPTDPTPTDPAPTDPAPTDPTPTCPTPVPPVQTSEPGPVRRVDLCAPELPSGTPSPDQ
ncbi:MAG: hypothetical protein JWQ93_745 [Marmoricola sp.]|nr:hypothetical protein [Marmoricola sp.]